MANLSQTPVSRGQILGIHQSADVLPVGPDGLPVASGRLPVGSAAAVHTQPHLVTRNLKPKSLCTAYMYWLLGFLGAHHFYLGRPQFGVIYLFTGGMVGIGWALDFFRLPCIVNEVNHKRENHFVVNKKKSTQDAYILWMPFGLLGFHQYYLGRMGWGVAYTFTLGLCGVGWLLDGFRMFSLVETVNEGLELGRREEDDPDEGKTLSDAFVLAASPFGWLGAHQYYMERWMFGILYTFTFGLMGVGWLIDMCSLPHQFKRAMKIRRHDQELQHRYLDEAYKLHFPLGFLGLHHFYLRRPAWGLLYFFTAGVLFMGWIIDFFRIPALVREANRQADEENVIMVEIQEKLGQTMQPATAPPGYTITPNEASSPGPIQAQVHAPPGSQPYMAQSQPFPQQPGGQQTYSDHPPPYSAIVSQPAMMVIEEEEEEEEHLNETQSVSAVHVYDNQVFQQDLAENIQNEILSKNSQNYRL